jgi:nucleoid DNA-binding protein
VTKQKKNELKEEVGVEEDEKNGTYGTNGMYENTELPESHASHHSHSSPQKALFAVIREALAQGQGVSLPGLGSFSVVLHAARMGRNPRTGESIAIPARRRIHFKMGKGLRELLNP